MLHFDGKTKDELDNIIEEASEIALEAGAIDVLVADTPAKIKDAWAARSSFLEAIKAETNWKDGLEMLDECDVVVPLDKIAPYVEYVYGVGDNSVLESNPSVMQAMVTFISTSLVMIRFCCRFQG